MSELPYSYHTFLFPFLWDDGGNVDLENFSKVLSIDKRWHETIWKDHKIPECQSTIEWLQDYAAYQYFTEPANAAIFNTRGDGIVRCFEYKHNEHSQKGRGKYVITKGADVFCLDINCVKLHVYDCGVAILILELENHLSRSLQDVNKINEYGRRINMPYLSPDSPHSLCADKIEIYFDDLLCSQEDYFATLVQLDADFDLKCKRISLNYVMKPIQYLLDGGGKDNDGYTITSTVAHKCEKNIYIKPCVDDRMFVCCLIADDELSEKLRLNNTNEQYSFLEGWNERDSDGGLKEDEIANQIYKMLFIETSVTCQNTYMKKELLLESVYPRWLDYGTLYGTTHHSLICLTSQGSGIVIPNFLTLYVQLAIFVLAQRAAILDLSDEASKVANSFNINGVDIKPNEIKDIEKLQARYVKVQSQLLISEATVQEQGVEVYESIKKHLYIEKNKRELDGQINNLRDVANISNDRLVQHASSRLNIIVGVVSFVALILSVLQVALSFYTNLCIAHIGKSILIIICVLMLLVIVAATGWVIRIFWLRLDGIFKK
jgi:hypothetical protein